jgi:predicted RNA-binding Zn ribbon-like protein
MKISPTVWTRALMIGGNPALDFANTLVADSDGPVDRLGSAGAFADWAAVAGLADDRASRLMNAEIARNVEAAASLYAEAATFRGALWRIFTAAASARPASADDLALLDAWLERAAAASALRASPSGYVRVFTRNATELERPIFEIARAAERLLLEGRLDRLHECPGAGCGWLFVDTSRNGSRRWCSMSSCGTASKVKTFRKRNKKTAGRRGRRKTSG